MKKLLPLFIALVILFSQLSISAYTFPQAFWALNDKYNAALGSGDDESVVTYAKQITALFEGQTASEAVGVLASRYYELANALERLGRYSEAKIYFEKSLPYNEQLGYSDAVKIAKAKAHLYTDSLDLYRSYYSYQTYYGAINEKRSGVLFGVNFDGGTVPQLGNKSLVLIYQHFGDTELDYNKHMLAKAAEDGCAVEYALNLPREGAQLGEVLESKAYLLDIIKMLAESGTPIFLRFAAEMDTWSIYGSPEYYIKAFRFVADLVHANSDNIALVWSPTQKPAFNLNAHDYYPGDEYVDWIGISLYMVKYFQGRDDRSPSEEATIQASFATGDAANPVMILDDLISTYGDRKPFMISESGASHTIRTLNRDETDYAVYHLKMLYRYVPMVYPQVKAIAHFDSVMPNEFCDFALSTNKTLQELYLNLVQEDSFIQGGYENESNCTYLKLGDVFYAEQGYNEFSTYAFFYGHDNLSVNYYLDGTLIGSSNELPYRLPTDLGGFTPGNHSLTVEAVGSGQVLCSKNYTLILSKSADVFINGEQLALSQKPIIENGTTIIPLRAVFEKLGGNVEWVNETRSIIITKGSLRLELSIGSYTMTKNGEPIELSVPARLINSTTYIPLRAVIQAMGGSIEWNGEAKIINISTDN